MCVWRLASKKEGLLYLVYADDLHEDILILDQLSNIDGRRMDGRWADLTYAR